MATASFDEKVVVTDPEMVAKIRKDLDDQSPVELRNHYKVTYEQMKENAKKTYCNFNFEKGRVIPSFLTPVFAGKAVNYGVLLGLAVIPHAALFAGVNL